jgi:4-alpha-glucanotransferase
MTGAAASSLHDLARAVGLARHWRDVEGRRQAVSDETLATILAALGFPASNAADIAHGFEKIEAQCHAPPALIVTEVGLATALPASLAMAELIDEDGHGRALPITDFTLPPIEEPGYYRLILGNREIDLAVAPRRCHANPTMAARKLWGPAIQIPALRGPQARPFGDAGDLDRAVEQFAVRGADAVAINPVHALFPGWGVGFSPYSPSSRQFLNGALGDPALVGLPPLPAREAGGALIDWEKALPQRMADLRAVFENLDDAARLRVAAGCSAHGDDPHGGMRGHALFDALDMRFRPGGARGWQDWPAAYRDPDGAAVRAFAQEQAEEVAFHGFVQWLARESLVAVQSHARTAGMAIGLISDLAVGVDPGGSDGWRLREHLLQGLTIGAPPDPLGPHGQNWALTGFSPCGLRESGFAPWIAMLRAAFAFAGGVRIDHAFGLERLWVVPTGQPSSAGTYLSYPFADMLRLIALESHRAQAIVVAEDLGTAPPGFGDAMSDAGMLGMRVLWFEQGGDYDMFSAPEHYEPMSVAMTGTHDTATVAGWWRGRDLDWAERLGRLPEGTGHAQAEAIRDWDRGLLWARLGEPFDEPRPAPEAPGPAVKAALRHIGNATSRLAIAPLEDLLALEEQPNLPGTVTEHPNWRRRLAAPLDTLLSEPATAQRIETLDEARKQG